MDAESILEMPSDIDELEKEKAIESIVLDSSADDCCRQDFDESEIVIDTETSVNVTNSLHDEDESRKSADIEIETAEITEKDSDSLDNEYSTNIVNKSPSIQPDRQSPQPTTPLPQQPQPVTSEIQAVPSQVITAISVASTVPTSPPSKVVYVKFIPKITPQSIVATVTPQSPPKAISLATLKGKYEKPLDKSEMKKVSPIKIPIEEPTTSNNGGSRTHIGHTVNLLNNNRILIKSVKNNHTNSAPVAIAATTKTETLSISPQSHRDTVSVIQQTSDSSEITLQTAANVNPIEHINQTDDKEVKCKADANNGNVAQLELEIKKEQLMNENSSEHTIEDIKPSDAIDDDKHLLSSQKIKREFEQLQKTVNESKVLSEFVIEHNKRSRRPTKSGKSKHKHNNSLVDLSAPVDDKMVVQVNRSVSPSSSSVRSASKESDRSVTSSFNSGGGSGGGKRNTRSMNTDFSAKQKKFLKGIQQVTRGTDDETDNNSGIDDDDDDLDYFAKQQPNISERRKSTAVIKQGNFIETPTSLETKIGWDKYCWRCHQPDTKFICSCCIRSYHANCLKLKMLSVAEMAKWQCPECVDIKAAEKENKKKKFDVKHFNKLLKYAMNRILQDPSLQQFQFPVNKTQNPGYSDVIVNPINLSKIEDNIDNLVYTNSEAFLSDIKWILHNCSIYFSDNYKVTRAAKSLQKVSKQEVGDIETCPECYLNANTMTDNWFTEVCARPHLILWAKLKGFPYWPAKAMSINSSLVDVRFFGEHDRANIPAKDCYLYSREDPNPPTNKYKRNTIADCVKEVDVYIENIMAKYGKFNYAELKTPFNPQMAEQHLTDMIPGLRVARGRRRSSIARSDLTLKIVKTADNHLSVVKKDQIAKELPQIKRTVDITGDGAVSRTPTPPSAVLARRKTSDTRIKRSKSTNRHSDGKLTTLDHKSYQVLRRKSMAVEKLNQKRVSAIHSTLDLNSSNESAEVSFIRFSSKPSNEKNETELVANPVAKKTNKVTAKKRKMSSDQIKSADTSEMPEKNQKLDETRATTSLQEEQPVDNFDGNILSSVGLMKRTSPPSQTPEKRKSNSTSPKVARNKNSTCDTNEKSEGAARTRTDQVQPDRSKTSSPLILVPFIEVKKELENDAENCALNRNEQTPSASQTPISLISSTENTPAKNNIEDSISNIKTETSSDDDSLMIIDDELSNNSSIPAKPTPSVDQLLDNIRMRGSISVKDINKMTLQNQQQQQHARKSFPKGPSNSTFSILKPRNNAALNKSNSTMSQTNMVCIPLDGLPRLDLNYNSTQPPPLSVVGSANSVSLLAQNQPLQTSQSAASSTATSTVTNGPPPLSITSIPTVVNVTQPSLLNSNSISTISNGMLTEQLASAVTDQLIRRNPPQLSARPAAPLRSESDSVFPTEAGSVCKTLMEHSHKMSDYFRSVIIDTLSDLGNMNHPEARIRLLEMELEKAKNSHAKEINDIKANTDRLLAEMKKSMEKERLRIVNETRKQCEIERIRSVEEAKKKQWCANCLKEAQFYCCWNTSYCNHICQRKHWEQHMATCAQVETSPSVQNPRKTNSRSATKPDVRQQTQSTHNTKPPASSQKDSLNVVSSTVGLRTGAKVQSIGVPALRNILPKNVTASVNQTTVQAARQSSQPHSKQNTNQSCIIVGRPLPNWAGSSTKSTSLLHPNAIFLPTSSQSYATITSVQSGAPASVSLLSASHAQGQKSNTTETIIIP